MKLRVKNVLNKSVNIFNSKNIVLRSNIELKMKTNLKYIGNYSK